MTLTWLSNPPWHPGIMQSARCNMDPCCFVIEQTETRRRSMSTCILIQSKGQADIACVLPNCCDDGSRGVGYIVSAALCVFVGSIPVEFSYS
ncbi:hypothetical protein JOB18_020930 [Solea senegalensis]|uniref:Uncharacterized protein n=1 Tax=Solea senegalensis TaxID=28829 RepID=A0AAV6SIY0_SOLSE|nr:hypothetical protein JOB18_020930 [Solea senegalensis]